VKADAAEGRAAEAVAVEVERETVADMAEMAEVVQTNSKPRNQEA